MKTLVPILALLMGAPAAAQVRGGPAFERAIVAMHDAERAEVGTPPVEWDAGLARDAAEWARHLSDIDDLVHWSEENEGDNGQGENLWMGTRGAYTLEHMVEGWSGEKRPLARMASWEDDHHRVGHYTQMVWAGTRKIGCAIAANRENEVLVCRYWPAGNVIGEQPYPGAARAVRQVASVR